MVVSLNSSILNSKLQDEFAHKNHIHEWENRFFFFFHWLRTDSSEIITNSWKIRALAILSSFFKIQRIRGNSFVLYTYILRFEYIFLINQIVSCASINNQLFSTMNGVISMLFFLQGVLLTNTELYVSFFLLPIMILFNQILEPEKNIISIIFK